jgi:hypothetical protein
MPLVPWLGLMAICLRSSIKSFVCTSLRLGLAISRIWFGAVLGFSVFRASASCGCSVVRFYLSVKCRCSVQVAFLTGLLLFAGFSAKCVGG